MDRADVEAYALDLEQAGRARSTVARRLATLAGFYRYAVEEAALPRSPVAHVRRPSVARDSQTLGLDRDEAARFLAAAETASTGDHALACLLMLNGLRVSEACAADVADLGIERAHRVRCASRSRRWSWTSASGLSRRTALTSATSPQRPPATPCPSSTRRRCLDLIDQLVAIRAHGIDRDLASIDR